MSKLVILRNLAAGVAVVGGVGLGERVADPFERHDSDYVIEGPQSHDGPFYASVNWYDAKGEKHDDRSGDALVLLSLGGALGFLAVRTREPSQ